MSDKLLSKVDLNNKGLYMAQKVWKEQIMYGRVQLVVYK